MCPVEWNDGQAGSISISYCSYIYLQKRTSGKIYAVVVGLQIWMQYTSPASLEISMYQSLQYRKRISIGHLEKNIEYAQNRVMFRVEQNKQT